MLSEAGFCARRRGPYLAAGLLRRAAAAGEWRWLVRQFNQEEPWWESDIQAWIARARAILADASRCSEGWRALFWRKLEREPPAFLYRFFEEWSNAKKSDAARENGSGMGF